MDDNLILEASEIAANVARQIHPRYAVYFDQADIRQELMIWALRKEKRVAEWLDHEQNNADRKAGIRQLAKAMQREADKYCRSRKAKAVGYETRDEAFYNAGIIEELIAVMDDVDNQQAGMQVRVSGGSSDPATSGNFLVSVIDVRNAMEKLDPNDSLILEMRYQEGLTLTQIGDALGLSDTTIHRRCNAALRRIIKLLGGESPYQHHGSRRVVTNSHARAMLE